MSNSPPAMPLYTTNLLGQFGVNFRPNILRESLSDDQGLALWIPRPGTPGFHEWERVRSAPREEFCIETGITAAPATLIHARQPIETFWRRVARRVWPANHAQQWRLPNGATAEQYGERQTDALLVWAAKGTRLDESWLRTRWLQSTRIQQLGDNLFLVTGVQLPAAEKVAQLASVDGCPLQQANEALAAARRQGNRQQEVTALTDLALIELNQKNAQRAVTLLEEALAIARILHDRNLERDVLASLGWANVSAEQPKRAIDLLQQALAFAREAQDRFAEKLILERLGHIYGRLGNRAYCLGAFHEALALARTLHDRRHEADLLWIIAIVYADLGERDQAIANAQAAIDVLEQSGNPQAPWYADHLRRFCANETADLTTQVQPDPAAIPFGATFIGAGVQTAPRPSQTRGPGLLRMAVTATQAMAKFLGSGLKTVSQSELERRLRTCAACPHYTGLRCRLCGCFTNTKARLPHEECPVGKWKTA